MKKRLLKLFIYVFANLAILQSNTAQELTSPISVSPLSIGDKVKIKSNILSENRGLNIYLPTGYSKDSTKLYPVIYLLDGSIDEDFIHIAGIVQFGSFSWINMIPESIVVGIANTDRKRDFTYPTKIKELKEQFPTSGKSNQFIQFLEKELQPFIADNYNVSSTKTLVGQSLGGLLATETLITNPDLFDNYVIVSPSIWWDDQSILLMQPKPYTSDKSIYIGVGKEGYGMEEMAEAIYNKLIIHRKDNTNLQFEFFEEKDHGDVLHQAAYNAFEFIFKSEKQ